jgi:hypothetical protein
MPVLTKYHKRCDTFWLKSYIVWRFWTPHRVNHVFVDSYLSWKQLLFWGVSTEYETEVNVEHASVFIDHQIL